LQQKQAENSQQSVVISADKNVRYEEVINVMDVLQQQHIKKVGLLAQTKGQ
jgi:biopolymer transport protein TolR